MNRIKYFLFVITAFILGITMVNAKEISIKVGIATDERENPIIIYDGTTVHNTENIMYDESTNTLTFNNNMCSDIGYRPEGIITDMGELNIVINGKNCIKDSENHTIYFDVTNTILHFSGKGTFVTHFNAEDNDVYFDNFEGAAGIIEADNIYINNSKIYNNMPGDADDINWEQHYLAGFEANSITLTNSVFEVNNQLYDEHYWTTLFTSFDGGVITIDNSNVKIQSVAGLTGNKINIVNNSTVDIYSFQAIIPGKLNIALSTVNIKYGFYGIFAEGGLNINNSKVNLEYINSGLMSEWIEAMGVSDGIKLPILTTNLEITGDVEILEGGNIYSDCQGEGDEQVCVYYIAEDEVDGILEVIMRMMGDELTAEDMETLNKLSVNVRIGRVEPEPEEVIQNVPNTGIFTIIGAVLGVGVLSCGAYLLIKSKKKTNVK